VFLMTRFEGPFTIQIKEYHHEISVKCPYCYPEKHQYSLEVKYEEIRYLDQPYAPYREETFERIFICPKKGRRFKASFTLMNTRENRILSVKKESKFRAIRKLVKSKLGRLA